MVGLYVIAGINHFYNSPLYVSIIPPWMSHKLLIVYVSGICEILLGLLLLPKPTRRFAAWGITFLLIAVFPANIQMAVNYYNSANPYLWIAIVRLPLQLLLIWWVWLYTKPAIF